MPFVNHGRYQLAMGLAVLLFLLFGGVARAQQPPEQEAQTPAPEPDPQQSPEKPATGFKGYFRHAYKRTLVISENHDQRWGWVTPSNPRGTLGVDFSVQVKRANQRYDADGNPERVLESIRFDDPYGGDGSFFSFDAKAKGGGMLTSLDFTYGYCRAIDFFARFPFAYEETWLEFEFEPGTSALLGYRTKEDFFRFFELMGRPRPGSHYKSKAWELRDFRVGASVNYFRNDYFSAAASLAMVFPTGRQADPNQGLIYGLGPQVDAGDGSFAPEITHGMDFRAPGIMDFLTLSLEGTYAYYLQGSRRSPRFLEPDAGFVRTLETLGFSSALFPDLSDLDDRYFVTPGSRVDALAFVGFDFIYARFGMGYELGWKQKPVIQTDSDAFEEMLDRFEAYESEQTQNALGKVTIPFGPYGVPVALDYEFRYSLTGSHTPRFLDDHKGTIQVLVPF